MDNHRFMQFAANLDMMNKRRLLADFGLRRVKVIKPGLAHRHHIVFCSKEAQFFYVICFILI
ncbi:Uncharacterised protein [Salmonella enterica subsp. enterica serovar Bovismorbificans]|uniref:Uncharacterized protein n=1 Tax=Salmonella enterica subsp. enterica serovar Bovismorbificans TaxID=58097 RepID=A0A655D648_SALET|nr:Uncharacterised protein [Salmonella enterica subsp. enterica serovar Bovismorbificans]CNV03649.1 Uncharacterised protein [Salmonella enterica subsp. enterica serovar Bovismorbificans]CPR48180.1 Uncharacterised protein [Salmonella enterica subsp. enterica serovar Bovismorbificans]